MALHELDADLKNSEATLRLWETKYPGVATEDFTARVEFELAWADAIAAIIAEIPEGGKTPTVAVMEAEATKRCATQLRRKREAEAQAEIAKKLIGIAETTLTSIQTRAKLDLIEAGLAR